MAGLDYKSNQALVGFDSIRKVLCVGDGDSPELLDAVYLQQLDATVKTIDKDYETTKNKDNDVNLGGATPSETKYPTQKAVKTFIDTAVSTINNNIQNLTTGKFDASLVSTNSDLNSADPTKYVPTQSAVKTFVESNISNVSGNMTTLINTKFDKNKVSKDGTLTSSDDTSFVPTQSAVKTYISTQISSLKEEITGGDGGLESKLDQKYLSTDTNLNSVDPTKYFPSQSAVKTYITNQLTPIKTNADNAVRINVSTRQVMIGQLEATGFFKTSDSRKKENILPISDTLLDAARDFELKQFNFKADGRFSVGGIVQEVPDALKFLVGENEDKSLSLEYIELLVLKVASLEREVKYLKSIK